MKWLSVKKFTPPMDIPCFIFTENNYCYLARLPDKTSQYWVHEFDCEHCKHCDRWTKEDPSYEEIYGVTHFCIPDAVEIDE